jgi:hypothetical protein
MAMRLAEFYEQDHRRAVSGEVKFGEGWRLPGENGSRSVFWVRDTGELVAYQPAFSPNSGLGMTLLEGIVSAAADAAIARHEDVAVLLVESSEPSLREALDGWERHAESPDGFAWLLQRAADAT